MTSTPASLQKLNIQYYTSGAHDQPALPPFFFSIAAHIFKNPSILQLRTKKKMLSSEVAHSSQSVDCTGKTQEMAKLYSLRGKRRIFVKCGKHRENMYWHGCGWHKGCLVYIEFGCSPISAVCTGRFRPHI